MSETPYIFCSTHGRQEWVTRCRWCKFDPLTSSSTVAPNGAGLAGAYGVPLFSFKLPKKRFEEMLNWMP